VGKSQPVVVYELVAKKGEIDNQVKELLDLFNEGVELYYERKWQKAIEVLKRAQMLEPNRSNNPQSMTPSLKIISYCNYYMHSPPAPTWDGVMALSSK
jgi:adenylate cyclase